MYVKIVHAGDLPIFFGEIRGFMGNRIDHPELVSKDDVWKLLTKARDLGRPGNYISVQGKPRKNFKVFKTNVEFIRAAGGAVFNDKDELLLIKRLGKWDLPKGKMEAGESKKECALREVEEECSIGGLEILNRLPDTYHMYELNGQWVLKKSIWYRMSTSDWKNATPQLEENIEALRWVRLQDLNIDSLETYATIRHLLHQL